MVKAEDNDHCDEDEEKDTRMVMAMIAIECEGKSGGVPVAESC